MRVAGEPVSEAGFHLTNAKRTSAHTTVSLIIQELFDRSHPASVRRRHGNVGGPVHADVRNVENNSPLGPVSMDAV